MATAEEVEAGGTVTICIPALSKEDPFFSEKKRLSDVRNLKFKYQLSVRSSAEEVHQILDQVVQAARILHMDESFILLGMMIVVHTAQGMSLNPSTRCS